MIGMALSDLSLHDTLDQIHMVRSSWTGHVYVRVWLQPSGQATYGIKFAKRNIADIWLATVLR